MDKARAVHELFGQLSHLRDSLDRFQDLDSERSPGNGPGASGPGRPGPGGAGSGGAGSGGAGSGGAVNGKGVNATRANGEVANGRAANSRAATNGSGPNGAGANGHAGANGSVAAVANGSGAAVAGSLVASGSNGSSGSVANGHVNGGSATAPVALPDPSVGPVPDHATLKHYDSPGRSAVAHIRLVVAMMALGALIGAAFAMLRPPTYSAEARLYVGKTMNLTNTAAIAGLANAGSQMASAYSRLITTSTVVNEVSKKLGHPGTLGGTLTASPVPQSPVIRVDATSSSPQRAVALAEQGARALIGAVNQINQLSQSQVTQLEQAYANDESTIENLTNTMNQLQAQLSSTPPAKLAALQAQITATNTRIKVAQLQADADSSQFQAQVSSIQGEEQVVSQEGTATATGSDRKTYLEISVLGGIIGGLIVSIALASVLDIRRAKAASDASALT